MLASAIKPLLGVAAVRRVTTTLALALCLAGCSSAASSVEPSATPSDETSVAPSGEPIGLFGYGTRGDMTCQDQLVEGSLLTGVELQDRLLNTPRRNPTTIEIWPLDTVVWPGPSGVDPERFVSVLWPLEYGGVRLAGGEVAVLDGAGHLVAMTGTKYRLSGEWAVIGAVGGPLFGKPPWIDGFDVCRGSESVIPQ